MSTTETHPTTDVRLPSAGTWQIDPSHSTVEFVARHLMVAKVRGRFADFAGAVTIAEEPAESAVEVTIEAASIDTGSEERDQHLRSPDFFAVEEHPRLRFASTSVDFSGAARFRVDGRLTIRDVTRPVALDVELLGVQRDPWGNDRAIYSASTEIDREDWGLTWNQPLEAGGVLVGRKVRIELEIETVRS